MISEKQFRFWLFVLLFFCSLIIITHPARAQSVEYDSWNGSYDTSSEDVIECREGESIRFDGEHTECVYWENVSEEL